MRTIFLPSLVATALCLLSASLIAQTPLKLPQQSPAASVTQVIGPATVTVEYHRPAVRNRAIWGALVPYGEVWRTGANEATTIRFSEAVKVEGHDVPAGTYSFFAIPTAKSWTLILNKTPDQWGAFKYAAANDLLRFEVQPRVHDSMEWLRYTVEPISDSAGMLQLAWEKLAVEFKIEVDSDKILLAQIDTAISQAKPDDWKVFLTGAKYYYDHNLSTEKATAWIDQSIAIQDGYQARECKGRLADRAGNRELAVAQIEKAIELAKGKSSPAYLDGLTKLLAEYKAKK